MVIALGMRKSPTKTVIEIKLKNSKGEIVSEEKVKGMFGCCQISFDSELHTLELNVKDW